MIWSPKKKRKKKGPNMLIDFAIIELFDRQDF